MTGPDEILASVSASPGRRWLGVGCIWLLAVMVIWVALSKGPSPVWQVFLLALGGASMWMAERMRRSTGRAIELTPEVLRDTSGTVLARVDEIERVDRGMFAFKPSNGFLLRTSRPGPRSWQPGLWWRAGRTVGIGGVTPGSQTKVMAEILQTILARRDGADV